MSEAEFDAAAALTGSLPWSWGATAAERAAEYPCAGRVPNAVSMFRAVAVAAPSAVVFRWICQLKVAPYSYDLIDNLGRRSPRRLTPGTEQLELGQRWMVYRIVDFQPGVQITGDCTPRWLFGPVSCTYRAVPVSPTRSRLVVRMDVGVANGRQRAAATALAWGDVVMMRKQLLTLKALAERGVTGRPGE